MAKILVGISLLSSDFFDIQKTIKKINESDIDFIHLDIMDGVFVPNISFGPDFVSCIRKHSRKFFDVHLMLKNPYPYIEKFVKSGAGAITVHHESKNAMKSLKLIKKLGLKCGIAINPETPATKIKKYLDLVDLVMIMTVHPGFSGQSFISNQLKKIEKIADMVRKFDKKIIVQVDGGINKDTAIVAKKAGATSLVSGNYLLKSKNLDSTVKILKK